MSESSPIFVRICNSKTPRLTGHGCCKDKGADNVLEELQDLVKSHELEDRVHIRPVNCLKNCHHGISVHVVPGPVWYGKVEEGDLKSLLEEHILKEKVMSHLQVSSPNSFF